MLKKKMSEWKKKNVNGNKMATVEDQKLTDSKRKLSSIAQEYANEISAITNMTQQFTTGLEQAANVMTGMQGVGASNFRSDDIRSCILYKTTSQLDRGCSRMAYTQ